MVHLHLLGVYYVLFFCKRKTAYELRISDWSSDVGSSDLGERDLGRATAPGQDQAYASCNAQRAAPVRCFSFHVALHFNLPAKSFPIPMCRPFGERDIRGP